MAKSKFAKPYPKEFRHQMVELHRAGRTLTDLSSGEETFGDSVTFTSLLALDGYGDVTVHARTEGTYDKTGLPDPLVLSLYFSLRTSSSGTLDAWVGPSEGGRLPRAGEDRHLYHHQDE